MNRWKIAIYYAQEYGVIIVDDIPLAGKSVTTPLNPVGYTMDRVSSKLIGEIVLERMAVAAQLPPVDKEETREYWKISGIKGFKKFSFIFSNVKLFSDDTGIHIQRMKTPPKTGGYAIDRSEPLIDLPIDIEPDILGETLLTVLRSLESGEFYSGHETLDTIGCNKLTFKTPGDVFEDCGDGHTDAYKVYRHSKSEETMLAIMIDSGYKGYDATSVREKWKQWYGELNSFTYDQAVGEIIIRATTDEIEVMSHLYQRGEETIEFFSVINKKAFKDQALIKVRQEIEEVEKSIRFLV